jgi:CBS domain-containing protein
MNAAGVPTQALKTVGGIFATNTLTFREQQNGLEIANQLLSTHATGAPVVDAKGRYIGFIDELDILKALEARKDLNSLAAEDLMQLGPIAVHEFTTIADAVRRMEDRGESNLPVEKDGRVAYSVSRHDLLRAWIGPCSA